MNTDKKKKKWGRPEDDIAFFVSVFIGGSIASRLDRSGFVRTIAPQKHVSAASQSSHRPAAGPGDRLLRNAVVVPVRGPRRSEISQPRVRRLPGRPDHGFSRRLFGAEIRAGKRLWPGR